MISLRRAGLYLVLAVVLSLGLGFALGWRVAVGGGAPALPNVLRVNGSGDAPVQVEVVNTHPGRHAQAEFRATNGVCGGNVWVSGRGYSDGSNFAPNEVGLTAESTCEGLHIRSNGDNYIRFSVGHDPREVLRITQHGSVVISHSAEPPAAPGGQLYVTEEGLFFKSESGVVTRLAPGEE